MVREELGSKYIKIDTINKNMNMKQIDSLIAMVLQ